MYEIALSKNRHYEAQCIVYYHTPIIISFVIDTGAVYSCCRYDFIDPSLKEGDFDKKKSIVLGGFVNSEYMRFYPIELKQFTIGNVDLGPQQIWITFDERISDNLLGVDILEKVWYQNRPDIGKLLVTDDE